MTVKIYRPEEIKDANLASSTLPEPDSSRGEVEWQAYDDKIYKGEINPPPHGQMIDTIYVDGFGIFILQGFQNDIKLYRYKISDLSLMSINDIPKATGFDRNGAGLSLSRIGENDATIHIGVYDRSTSNNSVRVGLVRFIIKKDLSGWFLSSGSRFVGGSAYSNTPPGSAFRVKTNGQIEASELVIVKKSMFLGSQTVDLISAADAIIATTANTYADVCITKSNRIYARDNASQIFFEGKFYFYAYELDTSLIEIRRFMLPRIDGALSSPRLSVVDGDITYSTYSSVDGINWQVYDLDMINIGSYKIGDEVIVKNTHKVYRAIKNAIFTYPPDNSQDGGDWIEVSPTNRWAMFDGEINTKSRSANGHTVNLTPSYLFDSVSVFGCKNVTEVRLTVRNSANAIIFQRNEDMNDLIAALEWQQDPLNPDLFSEVTIDGIPTAAGAKIELQFIGSNIEVGLVRYGLSREIGESLSGLSQNYFDYSKVEYNDFGKLIYQERPIVKLNTYNILVEREKTRSVDRLINSYRGQNLVWSGSTGNGETLVTYGRSQRSPLVYEYPNINELEITVRGSI